MRSLQYLLHFQATSQEKTRLASNLSTVQRGRPASVVLLTCWILAIATVKSFLMYFIRGFFSAMEAVVMFYLIMESIKVKYSKHMLRYLQRKQMRMVCAFIPGSRKPVLYSRARWVCY